MIVHEHEQGTEAWLKSRLGIPTGSRASDLITSAAAPSKSVDRYAKELAVEKYTGRSASDFDGNQYTEFGNEYEAHARAWYAFEQGVDVVETGFITDDLLRFGASPDGLVSNDGLAEFKCLPKKHVDALLYWQKNKKPPTDYVAQTHMEMLATDRAWCDLVFYSPDLPRLICRIERDAKFDDALKSQITVCLQKRDEILKTLELFERQAEAA